MNSIDNQAIIETLKSLLPGLVVFTITLILFQIVRRVIYSQLRRFDHKDLVDALADRIEEMGWTTSLATGAYLAVSVTGEIDPNLVFALKILFIIVWTWQAVKLVSRIINYLVEKVIRRTGDENAPVYKLLGNAIKFTILILILLSFLATLGYDISSLIAGLGIGGIAIALAVQAVLGDFISSMSIVADKPFKVGDLIEVKDHMGHVEKIGVRSTRMKSIEGENLVIPNAELVHQIIQNYGNLNSRRSKHTISVTYETDSTLLKDISVFISDILESVQNIGKDTYRVHMVEYNDSSIDFEVVFYINTESYKAYLDIQQEVLFAINDKFKEEGISFAYPTRTIYTNSSK